jgi:hypothetical protein
MNDSSTVTEAELKAKAVAPRVTIEDIDANIAHVAYFTARDGVYGTVRLGEHPQLPQSLGLLTFCVITLKNGFVVTGESACASPANFDPEIGRRLAYAQAKNKIWGFMGYALRDHLTYGGRSYWAQPVDWSVTDGAPL